MPGRWCLRNARWLDVDAGELKPASNIRIRDGVIEAVGAPEDVDCADLASIDAGGRVVMPGLWDMHVHLMINGHADYAYWDETYLPQLRDVIMPASAEQLLMAGITSARDLGGPLEDSLAVRDAINAGKIPGPTMYMSGPFIQKKPYPGTEAFRWGVDSPADARAKVRRLAEAMEGVVRVEDRPTATGQAALRAAELPVALDRRHRLSIAEYEAQVLEDQASS